MKSSMFIQLVQSRNVCVITVYPALSFTPPIPNLSPSLTHFTHEVALQYLQHFPFPLLQLGPSSIILLPEDQDSGKSSSFIIHCEHFPDPFPTWNQSGFFSGTKTQFYHLPIKPCNDFPLLLGWSWNSYTWPVLSYMVWFLPLEISDSPFLFHRTFPCVLFLDCSSFYFSSGSFLCIPSV
jgi:hypothetical protein